VRRERGRPHWGGRFQLGIGQALYVGPAFDTTPHAHHALQLCIALDGTFALRGPGRARWRRYAAALVAADHPHQLSGEGRTVCVLYLEPESARGRRLETVLDGRGLIDLTPRARSLRGPLTVLRDASATDRLAEAAQAILDSLSGIVHEPRALDPRITNAVGFLRAARGEYPSSAALGRRLGCSTGRFRHLFREQVGIGYRSYLLWLKVAGAADELLRGASLTTAAHAAGFSDSAHLARVFRRMFGLAPSQAPPFRVRS